MSITENIGQLFRQVVRTEYFCSYRIVYVVIDIGNSVRQLDDFTLKSGRGIVTRMIYNCVAHFKRQVQSLSALFEFIYYAQALIVMRKARVKALHERALPCVSKRRVTEIVSESRSLRQILIERKPPRDSSRNLRHLKSVGQTRSVMVVLRTEENLSLVHQSAEGFAMNNPVPVALKFRSQLRRRYRMKTPLCVLRKTRKGGKRTSFSFHKHFGYGQGKNLLFFVFR